MPAACLQKGGLAAVIVAGRVQLVWRQLARVQLCPAVDALECRLPGVPLRLEVSPFWHQ